ncbi:MAG: hypothetical protein EO766_17565 [Hydrotalea sp. AMD]|uniref:biosynthetic peptidoglycan transglycosylase n=1 Tax=Hydrotalea sp. AMD TaxID=2501297 RepID=UPI000945C7F0|nr:biosynthetic peptidoglycan transglycosylase [Hydrotalea sp. AMD]RWZ83843.1 MAG: hypothetical protein EO766_17565 [Hydrotalea sp. AMD]
MRVILGHIAKTIYRDKYLCLQKRLLDEYSKVSNTDFADLDTLSKLLISGEDHRFFYHIGFDIIAIARAVKNRLLYDKIEGASTIEQQLVRVLTNDYQRTFSRKIREILLATTLTSVIPKRAIPKIYLNVAYFGAGMTGLQQTFTKLQISKADKISLEDAASIISRIKYPQPRKESIKRLTQIEMRKQHLIFLYNKHLNRKYIKVYG